MKQKDKIWEVHDLGGTIAKRVGELPGAYDAVERHILGFYLGKGLEADAAEERSQKVRELLTNLKEFNNGKLSKKPSLTEFGSDITDALILAIHNGDYAKPDLLYEDATQYLVRQSKEGIHLAIFSDASTGFVDTCLEEVVGGIKLKDIFRKIYLGSEQGSKRDAQTYIRLYSDIINNGGLVTRVVDDDISACRTALSAARKMDIHSRIYMIDRKGGKSARDYPEIKSEGIMPVSDYIQISGGV